jgi:hypothetical protein
MRDGNYYSLPDRRGCSMCNRRNKKNHREMAQMNKKEREKAIGEIKGICKEIGCSKMDDSCNTKPFNCEIIRKLIMRPQEIKK